MSGDDTLTATDAASSNEAQQQRAKGEATHVASSNRPQQPVAGTAAAHKLTETLEVLRSHLKAQMAREGAVEVLSSEDEAVGQTTRAC